MVARVSDTSHALAETRDIWRIAMNGIDALKDVLHAGCVITKQSFPRWYEVHLKLLYWGIKRYQKRKWKKHWKAVHVYVVLPAPRKLYLRYVKRIGENQFAAGYVEKGDHILFEQTWPVAKWTHPHYLHDKTFALNKFHVEFNVGSMVDEACQWIGKPYDLGDLADFAISGLLLGLYKRVIRFVGDKARRLGVCSTVAGHILNAGGCDIEQPNATTPAYYEGNATGWSVLHRFERGKLVQQT